MAVLAIPLVIELGEAGEAAYLAYRAYRAAQAAAAITAAIAAEEAARKLAEDREKAAAQTKPVTLVPPYCADCNRKTNPCWALANGAPGGKYRGGAHWFMSKPKNDGLDSHHMPSDAASPLPEDMGPAIQMDPKDHWKTASNGRVPGSRKYVAAQKALIDKGEFMAAFAMDVADIKAKFPDTDKYDAAIAQAYAYAACLKKYGIIK